MSANRIWIFGTPVVVIAIVALGWVLGISPKLAEGDAADASRVEVDQQNAQQEAILVVLREQFENLDELKVQVAELQEELPGSPEVEGFIEYATGVAEAAGVVISSIKAEESIEYGSVPGDGAAAATPSAEGASVPEVSLPMPLYSVALAVEVQGSPEQVMAFSKLLQEGKRIFLPTQVTFSSGDAGVMGGTVTGQLFVLDAPSVDGDDEESDTEGAG